MNIGDIFRKGTRPAVTVIFAAVLAQVVVEKINAPDWFIALGSGVILWWFGDRTLQHLKEKTASAPTTPSPSTGEGQGPVLSLSKDEGETK